MKQLIAVLLIGTLILGLAGCSKDQNTDTPSSEVTYYDGTSTTQITKESIEKQVKAGTLTIEFEGAEHDTTASAEVALKMTSDQMNQALSQGEVIREVGTNYIRYTCNGTFLYYTNDDRDNGLAAIVYPGTVYGFEPTITTKSQIQAVMGEATEQPANDAALSMFLYGDTNTTYLDYDCGDHHVTFFINDNRLSMVALYQEGLWIY